ncbi:MAG TPA: metal-dependent hydrolase [Bryobacteraceae bacterium]|nr:metal-dependent hydrolase [Bryobacteraceae bacterium]
MDNVTHSLTGLLLARAGLARWTPGGTAVVVLASNIPDADIVTSLWGGALTYLEYHRHWTHALLAGPLMGLLAALAFCWVKGWRLGPAWALGTAGVWVHILLDLLNHYGVRIWLPFRADWVSWDLFMVVDPWVMAVLLLCVLAPLLARLVGGEIGGQAALARPGRGWAIFGLAFLLFWIGGRAVLHQRAVETLRARNYRGQAPVRVAAWPTPWNPLLWQGYVSTETFWSLPPVNLREEFDPERGETYYKPETAEAINAARRTPEAQAFLRFAQYPVWRILPAAEPEGGVVVEATDVRFGLPEDGKFQLRVTLDTQRRALSATFAFGNPLRGASILR